MIVFVLTCAQVDYLRAVIPKLFRNNNDDDINIWYIHGRLNQKIRTKVHRQFTKATNGALICTDVVARGIDIPDIDLIIQFDPPQKIDFFVHRVGRTARMGKFGKAIVLLREHEVDYLQLLKIRKIPITKEIKVVFKKRMFSKNQIKSFICDDDDDDDDEEDEDDEDLDISCDDIKMDEINALTSKLQDIQLSDREIFNKANHAFVSFIEAYNNHECKYIFRINRLNSGKIANCMGLLYLPKIKRLQLHGKESFVKKENVDFNNIAFKRKDKEKERQQKLNMIKEKKVERQRKREQKLNKIEKEKNMNDNDKNEINKKKKQRKTKFKGNVKNKKRKASFQQNNIDAPSNKKQKRMEHKLREFRHYQREELLLRKLKKNQISQNAFDRAMGYKL